MSKIKTISAYKVLNSRADWTLRTRVELDDGSVGVQTIPDGASKGQNEAVYVPIEKALDVVNTTLNKLLSGRTVENQAEIDAAMLTLDSTPFKSNLGGNSIVSVSLAVAQAAAVSQKIPLYKYLANLFGNTAPNHMPTPLFNVINGGKHAHNDLSFQEFMVIPSKSFDFPKAYEVGVEVYHALKTMLIEKNASADVGDEGGFAPAGFNPKKALDFLRSAVAKVYNPGEDVFFGMDVAAESFYEEGNYKIKEESLHLSPLELKLYYSGLMQNTELIYIEDPFYEKDVLAWQNFNSEFGSKLMVVGDDLVVTNPKILANAVKEKYCNAVIVKVNQVGTLTETLDFIKMAKANAMSVIVSHRSGETAEDTFIADLSVAVGADFIKSGAPARGERVVKYNRLLEIYRELHA